MRLRPQASETPGLAVQVRETCAAWRRKLSSVLNEAAGDRARTVGAIVAAVLHKLWP